MPELRRLSISTGFVLAAWLLSPLIPVSARQTPQATFRGGVELVALDFLAVSGDRPVEDLRADELKLTVDGHARDIRQLQFLRLAKEEAPARAAAAPSAPTAPLPFASNRAGEGGRTVIFVFDDNHIRPGNEQAAKAAALKFLDSLGPADRVAVATAARIEADLTTDRARVRAALQRLTGHGPAGTGADATTRPTGTAIQQGGSVLAWFRDFLEHLQVVDGPKTVIFIAEGEPSIVVGGVPDPGIAMDYRDLSKAAGVASAQLYIIQPNNFASDASQNSGDLGMTSQSTLDTTNDFHGMEDAKLQGLQDLATVTGGELFRLSGSADSVFEHIVRQSSAYYLLGFQPESSERNGKSHRIQLKVTRPGVTIRARPEFTIPKPNAKNAAAPGSSVPAMLSEITTYREVPIRISAFTVGLGTRGAVNVLAAVESVDASVPLRDVGFALIDTKTRTVALAFPSPLIAPPGTRVIAGAQVPPGTYRLRVAALSQDGGRGTAEYEFTAGLTQVAPLTLGDLMVGQGKADGSFEPELMFGSRAAATGYLEMQGALPIGTAMTASFELARTVDGPALFTVPGLIGPTATAGRLSARGAVPIGAVPDGDYVVRATIKMNGTTMGTLVRALRKTTAK